MTSNQPFYTATITIPTISETNCTKSRWYRAALHKLQKRLVKERWLCDKPQVSLPVTIRLVRIALRKLDAHDNLPTSLKYVCDAVADCLIPNKAAGQADSSPLIKWHYGQEIGKVRMVRIEIYLGFVLI